MSIFRDRTKLKYFYLSFFLSAIILFIPVICSCQEENLINSEDQKESPGGSLDETNISQKQPVSFEDKIQQDSQNITFDFKDADIRNVLKMISLKAGINIVSTPEVMGTVTIRLVDVPWERALDVLLKTYGYGYQRQGNVILVTKLENISKIQAEEQLVTEVFYLKFLDAVDAQKAILPLLSTRGKVTILYSKGQKGWDFGTFQVGPSATSAAGLIAKEEKGQSEKARSETVYMEKKPTGELVSRKAEFPASIRSKILIITDTISSLDKIRRFLEEVDKKPRQILVETRIMEVNRDRLKDIGFDWGTGSNGAQSTTITTVPIDTTKGTTRMQLGGHMLSSQFPTANFSPKVGVTNLAGSTPFQAGLDVVFQKLTGTQLEVLVHALEEDVNTNILSAPKILTLENQEAAILVGYQTPILKSEVSGGTDSEPAKLTQSLWYYQPIGISVNVVPQVSQDNYINMIIHPRVTSSASSVTATSISGTLNTTVSYPIIDVREAETQILLKDGETVVIGGLLKDIKSKGELGIPFLSKIPFLGVFFKRETIDTSKIDLLIFITARIVKDEDFTPEEIAKMEKNLGKETSVTFKSKINQRN